jgi:hypothetical protein
MRQDLGLKACAVNDGKRWEIEMRRLLLGGVVLATAVLGGYAVANVAPPMEGIDQVRFAGCVKPGVEAGCLIVESDGKVYDVTSAKSRLKVGHFASGRGRAGIMSACMQGEALGNIVLDTKPPAHAPCVPDQNLKTQ